VRLALRRALGGLGGAIGALPSLSIARGLAERWAGPATLPGAERLAGDVKAATWGELAVCVFLVPASAFVFGRLLPDVIRRRGGFCVALPGVAMGGAFLLWRLGGSGSPGIESFSARWLDNPNTNPAARTACASSPTRSRFGPIFMAVQSVNEQSYIGKPSWCSATGMTNRAPACLKSCAHSAGWYSAAVSFGMKSL